MITDIIKNTIKSHKLINRGDKILIGLSGGADSVCLTHTLFSIKDKLDITLYTAHVNHGIRGEEALRDKEFAKSFSDRLGIKCFTLDADVPSIAEENGTSEETAGRQVRYEFFKKLCKEHGIDKIATAHNKNDNAETLLMNFMRGSSVKGLSGIPYTRDNIIRPLLDVSREEIEEYCAKNALEYVTDSTNGELLYTRNKIRHTVIPLIKKEFNPNFITTVCDNAVLIGEDSAYIEKKAGEACKELIKNGRADINGLLGIDISLRRRVIRKMIYNARQSLSDVPAVHVDDVLSLLTKNSGASVNLSDGIVARVEYGKLIIGKSDTEIKPFEYTFKCGSEGIIPELAQKVTITAARERNKDSAIYLSAGDADTVTIRSRREGDIFMPCGMTGSKKVKEYFINEKIPREKRNAVPIIEIDGQIAAAGSRVDRRFLFKDNGIRIEFKPIQEVED